MFHSKEEVQAACLDLFFQQRGREKNFRGQYFKNQTTKMRPRADSKAKIQSEGLQIPLFEQERKWFYLETD